MEKKVTEVVAALIWIEDKFLICQRPAHKARELLWEFVGGKVEPGEAKKQALIREYLKKLCSNIWRVPFKIIALNSARCTFKSG